MATSINCPKCSYSGEAKNNLGRKTVFCPSCGQRLLRNEVDENGRNEISIPLFPRSAWFVVIAVSLSFWLKAMNEKAIREQKADGEKERELFRKIEKQRQTDPEFGRASKFLPKTKDPSLAEPKPAQ